PVTQVKMMRACVHLRDPEIATAVRRPIASNIDWVRSQALILLSAGQAGASVNLASEIGIDLTRGALLARLPSYLRAIARSRQRGAATSLAIGLAAVLLQLAMFAAAAAVVYWSVHLWDGRLRNLPALVLGPADAEIFGTTLSVVIAMALVIRVEQYLAVVV